MNSGLVTLVGTFMYLDPGAGSYLFQFMIATVLGVGFSVKLYWKKIASLLSRRSREESTEEIDHV